MMYSEEARQNLLEAVLPGRLFVQGRLGKIQQFRIWRLFGWYWTGKPLFLVICFYEEAEMSISMPEAFHKSSNMDNTEADTVSEINQLCLDQASQSLDLL